MFCIHYLIEAKQLHKSSQKVLKNYIAFVLMFYEALPSLCKISVSLEIVSPEGKFITLRLCHWKSHWKVQPHWNTSKTTLKIFAKDNHIEIFYLITLNNVSYCHSRMLNPYYNPTVKSSALPISFVLSIFSVTLLGVFFSV